MPASPSRPHSPASARAALVLAGAVLAAITLSACTPGSGAPDPSASPTNSGSTDGGTDPSPTPTSTDADPGGDERAQNLADAISSGNTAAIEGYLTDPTRVVIAASEADMQQAPVDAVLSVDYVQPGSGTWDFDLDATVLAAYAASADYGQFFPANAIVGRSDSGAVISFMPNGAKIGTIFMAIDGSLITG